MKKDKKTRGRPSTITLVVDKKKLDVANQNIKQILKTEVKGFAKSGGYIPMSQEYAHHKAFVIVLER